MARIIPPATILIAFLVFLPNMVLAIQYVVGDDLRWDTTGFNLQTWANSKTFKVGDVLYFWYDPAYHNVALAADSVGYENCASDPDLGSFDSGSDAFPLNSVGTYYFLCGIQCVDGHKVMINVN